MNDDAQDDGMTWLVAVALLVFFAGFGLAPSYSMLIVWCCSAVLLWVATAPIGRAEKRRQLERDCEDVVRMISQ